MDYKSTEITAGPVFTGKKTGDTGAALKGELSAADIFFSVVAWAAPLMVVVGLIPSIVGFSGEGIVVCFGITTIILLIFAIGYMAFVRHVKRPGAFYTYVVTGLGKSAGLGSAFIATFSYLMMLVTTWIAFGVFGRQLIHDTFLGPDIPWWCLSLVGILAIAVLSSLAVDLSAKVLTIALVLEVAVVTIFDVAVFINGGPDGISAAPFSFSSVAQGGLGIGVLFAVLCFIGFESSALYREEAKNPDVTIPRVTFISVISIGIFYVLAAWATVTALGSAGVMGAKTADVTTMFAQLSSHYVGKMFSDVVNILMLTSSFACLLSLHNGVTRYAYSLGRDGVLPARLGQAHPRHHSPYYSSAVVSAISAVTTLIIAAVTHFEKAGTEAYGIYVRVNGIGTVGVLILMCLVSVSIFCFFRSNRALSAGKPLTTFFAPLAGIAGLAIILVLATVNISTLMGSGASVSMMLISVLPVVFLGGCFYARWLKVNRPGVFARIGRQ